MKINGPDNISNILDVYQLQVNKAGKRAQTKQESPVDEGKDLLEISPEAKELQRYRQELAGLSDARPELVKAIQQQIKEGNFIIEAKKIAAGLIEEINSPSEEK
ncbi:MAG TPA: flagellar biosynthesis anti-sigma factor FlgM [Desulfotomaculum sp.]|jgi:negative regulator of flagellin synthesis FlgM|nr:flagellar biosynthesis anti-sigma factor FlgM [Desulfotomaculum sp.]